MSSVVEAYQLGAVDYLVKPLIPEIVPTEHGQGRRGAAAPQQYRTDPGDR